MMKKPDSTFGKALVAYFGLIQTAHIVAILRAAWLLRTPGPFPFPAPPPVGGWTDQTLQFMMAMGAIDLVNALASLVFVWGFFKRTPWRLHLGIINLTVATYSALQFAYGTILSGAWGEHPIAYFSMVLVYIPIALFTIALPTWVFGGPDHERS
jgi:hypothetical protein